MYKGKVTESNSQIITNDKNNETIIRIRKIDFGFWNIGLHDRWDWFEDPPTGYH
jgi:hypothetical protein